VLCANLFAWSRFNYCHHPLHSHSHSLLLPSLSSLTHNISKEQPISVDSVQATASHNVFITSSSHVKAYYHHHYHSVCGVCSSLSVHWVLCWPCFPIPLPPPPAPLCLLFNMYCQFGVEWWQCPLFIVRLFDSFLFISPLVSPFDFALLNLQGF